MQNQEMKMIIRITGMIAVIFCLLALVLPWGEYFYTWGISGYNYTSPFYIDFFTQGASVESIFFAIAMIIIFILTIITLILGIISVIKINTISRYIFLTLGIICIFEFIFYIVAVTIASRGSSAYGMYSVGFVLILIAGIIYIVSYVMQIAFGLQPKSQFQQMLYQQSAYQQSTPVQTATQPEMQKEPPAPQKPTKKSINFCPNCGSELKPGAKFCTNCGSKIS